MSVFHENMLIGSSGQGAPAAAGISRSLRFNSSDSAYLSRTPASAGNRKTWTFSAWIKRCALSPQTGLFAAGTDLNNLSTIYLGSNGTIWYYDYVGGATRNQLSTTSVYRDFSAWMHVLVAVNTTQATEANRVRIYVNGAEVTAFSTATYPSQNADTFINSTGTHTINKESDFYANYGNMYVADAYFIDGQQLTPSSFTETDATTGQLIPKAYTGSYGTNGFHLEFADNSSNTATTLGKDTSGNGNNWTPNNLSVTAGAGNDSLVDVPTNGGQTDTGAGGEVRGNYATWNPIANVASGSYSNGALEVQVTGTTGTWYSVPTNFAVQSGKWYAEITCTTSAGSGNSAIGIAATTNVFNSYHFPGYTATSYGYINNAQKTNNGSGTAYGATWTAGDTLGIAYDGDNGTLTFYKNGVSQGQAYSSIDTSRSYYLLAGSATTSSAYVLNAGQRPFAYTAPSGFKALCTANLPAPLVTKPSTVMDVALYTGTGSALTPTSSLGFNPDLVWIKGRSGATDHSLYDSVRGVEKRLESNTTDAEVTSDGGVTAFNTAGFSVGTLAQVNTSSATYAAWAWDAGSSTVTNTQGSITSSVRANASAGFSIVSFSSGSAGNYTVGHGLGAKPHFIITKARNGSTFNWSINHISIATTVNKYLAFTTNATLDNGAAVWGANLSDTNSTTFGISSANAVEANKDCIAYCFAPVAGYSSFGSYTGNGSTDGPFVYTGFRPRWVMIKRSDSTEQWYINDAARDDYNVTGKSLRAQSSGAEASTGGANSSTWDILSNGFKLRDAGAGTNASGATYIYAAFAESPFQFSRAR